MFEQTKNALFNQGFICVGKSVLHPTFWLCSIYRPIIIFKLWISIRWLWTWIWRIKKNRGCSTQQSMSRSDQVRIILNDFCFLCNDLNAMLTLLQILYLTNFYLYVVTKWRANGKRKISRRCFRNGRICW